MQNNRRNLSLSARGGAVHRTYVEPEIKFKEEGYRLAKYNEYGEMYHSSVKLAKYGFIPLGDNIVECVYGAEIRRLEPRRYNSNEIRAIHRTVCPVITGVDYDNVELRDREAEDSDANRAIAYLVNMRAPAIRARQRKEGEPYLDKVMVQAFMEFYSVAAIRSAIQDHFEENGLFPNREMLFCRLEI